MKPTAMGELGSAVAAETEERPACPDAIPPGESLEAWFSRVFCNPAVTAYQYLLDEFEWLQACPEASWSRSQVPFLRPRKNTRTIQAASFSVNAHGVEGWGGREYICCEGPNSSSTYDFWEMVWQEDVEAILMLNTPFEERLFPKTYNPTHETIQYWPLNSGDTMHFAPWKITCLNTALKNRPSDIGSLNSSDPNVVYRISMLSLVENNPIRRPAARKILHICYYRWPDGEIPQAPAWEPSNYEGGAEGLVELLREELGMVEGRVCVHCHAGIGRTGVAVALDIAANRLLDTHAADVRDTLRRIRTQRPKSVMNVWQYAYINLALARFALSAARLAPHPRLFAQPPLPIPRPGASADAARRIAGTMSSSDLISHAWTQLAHDFTDGL